MKLGPILGTIVLKGEHYFIVYKFDIMSCERNFTDELLNIVQEDTISKMGHLFGLHLQLYSNLSDIQTGHGTSSYYVLSMKIKIWKTKNALFATSDIFTKFSKKKKTG